MAEDKVNQISLRNQIPFAVEPRQLKESWLQRNHEKHEKHERKTDEPEAIFERFVFESLISVPL
jgi:hypothetical protein